MKLPCFATNASGLGSLTSSPCFSFFLSFFPFFFFFFFLLFLKLETIFLYMANLLTKIALQLTFIFSVIVVLPIILGSSL
ncbi:hypothetical protein IC582_014294 [Cucumis melo]